MITVLVPGVSGLKFFKEGGSSYIFRGVRTADSLPVAVKVLKPEVAKKAEEVAQFQLEAEILLDLHCRSIIKCYTYSKEAKPTPAIVMEFFESENLKLRMIKDQSYALQHWHRITYETAGALMYIHKRSIIHRDMKPENILASDDGWAKLIDFSLALTSNRKPRTISGTPSYISPEQITKAKITPLTDVYSFGASIYEMLAGRPPFIGASAQEVLEKHLKQLPVHLSKLVEGLDPEFASFVMRMLAKEPANRPQEIKEMLLLLKKLDPKPLLKARKPSQAPR